MKKKKLIIGIAAGAVIVALAIILLLALGRKTPEPVTESSSQSTVQAHSSTPTPPPESSSTPPPISASDSIPYVGPVDNAIVGKWEQYYKPTSADPSSSIDPKKPVYNIFYEFTKDGTFIITRYDVLDEEYPENWEFAMYNYTFDTFRGEDVMYCEYFTTNFLSWLTPDKKKTPLYYRFYTWEDGRDAMDIWQKGRDGNLREGTSVYIFLRLED